MNELDRAKDRLADAWSRAEAKSLAAGVSCSDTTATAEEIAASLDASADAISTAIDTSSARGRGGAQICEADRHRAAARACLQLLRAESTHMRTRSEDRTRERLSEKQEHAFEHLERAWTKGAARMCQNGPSAEEAGRADRRPEGVGEQRSPWLAEVEAADVEVAPEPALQLAHRRRLPRAVAADDRDETAAGHEPLV